MFKTSCVDSIPQLQITRAFYCPIITTMNDNLHIAKGKNLTLFNPSFIDDYGFTPEEFRVFARIMRRAAGENSLGCFETVSHMAMTLGISKRLVQESLRILRGCNCITIIEREGQSHLISFNTCDKWLPPHRLIEVRYEVSGTRIERDRERKMTPSGNATRSGNALPPLSETLHKGIPIKSIPKNKKDEASKIQENQDILKNPSSKIDHLPSADARSKHPAIVAVRDVIKRFPDKDLWDKIIGRLGDAPDAAKLSKCWLEWKECGYNKASLKWIDWYFTGIPTRNGNGRLETVHVPNRPTARQMHAKIDAEEALLREQHDSTQR